MIRKLTFLAIVLFLASCTITRRIHRPGYHVQWKKVQRTQEAKKHQSTFQTGKEHNTRDDISLKFRKIQELTIHQNIREISPTPPTIQIISSQEEISPLTQPRSNIVENAPPVNIRKHANLRTKRQSIPPIFWRTPPENLRKLGIALMILGGVLLLASLLLVLGVFAGNSSSVWLNFFLDLISISEWFWLLFVLVIILFITYLFYLLVFYVLGGPLIGSIIGLILLGLGIFFYILGKRRTHEP